MTPDSEKDRLLVERIKNGETLAFDRLVAPYRRRLQLQIVRIVKDQSDAEDVLQETLIRAYRGIRNFRGEASFYTWIFRIAFNCAIAFVTRRRQMLEASPGSESGYRSGAWEASGCEGPEELACGKQMAATVGAALESMRPEFKAAIMLREFDGMSYGEIAGVMLCPLGTVKSRISSARQAIALQLQQEGFLPVGGEA
ncbi:MAG: sigma-70 family RNA polymerase sigma factor [Bdellovibrionales bacterium]|nr:sigma-70 family RNA polymerase sigma factor [Massilia sp.]